MARQKKRSSGGDAFDIMWRDHYEGRPDRIAAFEREKLNVAIAHAIYELRKQAGMTQAELAKVIGTQASAISRLENADYNGRSLSMLIKIASIFTGKVAMSIVPASPTQTYLRAPSGRRMAKKHVLTK